MVIIGSEVGESLICAKISDGVWVRVVCGVWGVVGVGFSPGFRHFGGGLCGEGFDWKGDQRGRGRAVVIHIQRFMVGRRHRI